MKTTQPPPVQRVTITADELAKMLGTSRATVYAGLRSGKIPSRRIGKKFLIPRSAIEEWLKLSGPDRLPATASGAR